MMRNNSSSIISSLQMDYGGDSDEEESDSKNTSRSNLEEEQVTVKTEVKVEIEASVETKVTSASETEKTLSDTKSDIKKEVEENVPDDVTKSTNEETQDVKQEPEISPAELISDDEDGDTSRDSSQPSRHHHHHHHHHHYSQKLAVAEAVNTDSPSSQGSLKAGRKATRLVSYGPDEDVDEDESSSEEEEVPEPSADNSPELNSADASILSRSVQNMVSDDIKIPPEPPGKCSAELQKKIEELYARRLHGGLDLNRVIQSKKNFRNPSIYEKLIDHIHIDEKGTNFPPEIYDPHIWGKESFYDELDKAQRKDMERREKEKKERTKIEFMTGTKKSSTAAASDSGMGPSDEKKRKTKWDAQPAPVIHVSKMPTAQQNPGVVNLTAVATGTKGTVIPAVGSLSKKPSSSSGK